ncbi:hypothetical protein LLE49_26890 [Alicyclobacillus tolerans]|uniref:hypothetical protein n=1 Tax=Alicyclobacillus tolerans TaxID=90970 RepID=UPI001F3145EA|nr:hypothetical protein [Alicyclobacillus tolerans]MCF8568351.1 hypothetical protein [Alicyclobacillus tolerans]
MLRWVFLGLLFLGYFVYVPNLNNIAHDLGVWAYVLAWVYVLVLTVVTNVLAIRRM